MDIKGIFLNFIFYINCFKKSKINIKLSFPGIDHQMRMNAIRTIASKVMPHFLND